MRTPLLCVAACALLAACASTPHDAMPNADWRITDHRHGDDLLTAGLGLAGLRNPVAPAYADPAAPTPAEVRRRAAWANWRGIADLAPDGGLGTVYGHVDAVPGREFTALATLPGATQPHRVLVQVPDGFDHARRCVLVAAASGSRGVYGALAVAGSWGLPRGCAVVTTDKAAGTDYMDLDAGLGIRLDGTVGTRADGLAFDPAGPGTGIAYRHAHSGDNPEAMWGRHVEQAARLALLALDAAFPAAPRFTPASTRIVAVGLSNGGGAVLRAAEHGDGWLDGVVAAAPNVTVAGARPLYDVATQAALLMPCALGHLGIPVPGADARCASLVTDGTLPAGDVALQRQAAYDRLRAGGWSDAGLRAAATSTAFDLWRAVAAGYASAYGRFDAGAHPCGYRYAAVDTDGAVRAATAAERAAWPGEAAGIPPGAGVQLLDPPGDAADPAFKGLRCLRGLWDGQDDAARRVRAGIEAIRAAPPAAGVPVLVIHGRDDGLVAPAFTSDPYVRASRAAGRGVRYWDIQGAQHFDAFLALPGLRAAYVPLLPYVHHGLDRMTAHLDGAPLPDDAVIAPRAHPGALGAQDLALPR